MTTARRARLSVFLACLELLLHSVGVRAQQTQRPIIVREITVEGNRRVQEAVILGRVQSKTGTPFSPTQLSEDIRSIFGLGFFDDAQIKVEDFEGGVRIIFVVVERPFVRDVEFIGNKKLPTAELQDKIDIKLGSVYNPVDVQKAREKLTEAYETEGYFEVQITPTTEKLPDGDVKVAFNINEGRRITIEKIVIRGNKGLTERQIKRALATQEREYFIFRGKLQRQKLDEDVERILALYNDHGYMQARVEGYDVAVDREKARVTLTFTVVEGLQYKVDEIRITGVTLFPEAEIRRLVLLKPGDVYSRSKLRDSVHQIQDLYSTIGRAAADVAPKTEQKPDAKVTITFEISEGPEVYVERINITGNLRSQDKILRREIPMAEGELFTLQKLQRARQRLINLGYFETVNATTTPGTDKTKIIVNIEVTERATGVFSIGGGYSSADNFVGTIDLSQRNFLGRGLEASVRLRLGANVQQGIVSFTDPWFLDRPLAAGFDLFSIKREFSEYDYRSIGGGLRLSHPFAEYWRWQTSYRLTQDDISNVAASASDALKDQEGTTITSAISLGLTRDSRDSLLAPTRGGQTSIVYDFAGIGGDSKFMKIVASQSYFKPIWFGHVLSFRSEIGYGFGWADEPLPLFERFFMGGPNSIRSFKFRELAPKDDTGTRIGGNTEILNSVEYLIPLPFGIRLAIFTDIGQAYGFGTDFDLGDLRKAVGAGVRWNSPFGPLRVDYGINADRRKGEDFGAIQFSVGTPF